MPPPAVKHRRIITLRHFALFVVVALVALAALNVISELRAPRGNEYGRPAPVERVSTNAPDVEVDDHVADLGDLTALQEILQDGGFAALTVELGNDPVPTREMAPEPGLDRHEWDG